MPPYRRRLRSPASRHAVVLGRMGRAVQQVVPLARGRTFAAGVSLFELAGKATSVLIGPLNLAGLTVANEMNYRHLVNLWSPIASVSKASAFWAI
ncbi:hypothetical protein F5Y12DRAFT_712922 [Xylaria sp. FL1777]|nr:hypothetical protein F5Y12DRAFT_712922 [Xylaria sp. FL1777]